MQIKYIILLLMLSVSTATADPRRAYWGVLSSENYWTPSNITVSAWYDATDTSKVLTSGSAVTNWLDKSGNNRHIYQTNSTQRPVYATPIINFGGLTNYLFNTNPFMYSAGSVDVFIVGAIATNLDRRIVSEVLTTTNTTMYAPAQVCSADNYMGGYARNATNAIMFSNTNRLSILSVFSLSVTNLYHWRDQGTSMSGRVAGSNAITVAYTRTGTVAPNRFSIGALAPRPSTPAGSFFVNANIGEIVIASVQSDDNRQKLEGYLAWKWGLRGNLPANHPYKDVRPKY